MKKCAGKMRFCKGVCLHTPVSIEMGFPLCNRLPAPSSRIVICDEIRESTHAENSQVYR